MIIESIAAVTVALTLIVGALAFLKATIWPTPSMMIVDQAMPSSKRTVPQNSSPSPSRPSPSTHLAAATVLIFEAEQISLTSVHLSQLAVLAEILRNDDGMGLQLVGYASGDMENSSHARRVSLSRTLNIRKYLMDGGIRSTRIEVRALGNQNDGGPVDRVSAIPVAR